MTVRATSSERLLPKQSARLQLVNDVNFMLYTPFLPEAAAGTAGAAARGDAAARRCCTAPTCGSARSADHDPGGAHGRRCERHEGEDEELRYDQLVIAVGSVSRTLPVPGLDRHAIGFKSLADAIWLRNHVVETLEMANATEDPARRERAADLRLRRRRLRRARGARGAPGLRRRRDGPLPPRPPARDALDPGRGDRPRAARDRREPRRLRAPRAAGARDRDPPRHDARGGRAPTRATLSTGETVPTRTVVWTAGVDPAPEPGAPVAAAGRTRPGRGWTSTSGVEGHGRRLGARRLRRGARDRAERPRAADRPARRSARPAWSARNVAAGAARAGAPSRYRYSSRTAFVNLGRYKAVGRRRRRAPSRASSPGGWRAPTTSARSRACSARSAR